MFCSQSCFAKNWLEHRNTLHPVTVPHTSRQTSAPSTEAASTVFEKARKKRKRKASSEEKGGEEGAADSSPKTAGKLRDSFEDEDESIKGMEKLKVHPWGVLPSANECEALGRGVISPALCVEKIQKAIIVCRHQHHRTDERGVGAEAEERERVDGPSRCKRQRLEEKSEDEEEASVVVLWWSAAAAAAHVLQNYRKSMTPSTSVMGRERRDSWRRKVVVTVVAGDPLTAHAFAWACRCAGLAGCLRLHVQEEYEDENKSSGSTSSSPSDRFSSLPPSGFFVVITTEKLYQRAESHAAFPSPHAEAHASSRTEMEATSGKSLLQDFVAAASPSVEGSETNPTFFLLVTLPDVEAPEVLERSHLPSLFFVGEPGEEATEQEREKEEETENGTIKAGAKEAVGADISLSLPSFYTHQVHCFGTKAYKWMESSFWMGAGLIHLEATAALRSRSHPPLLFGEEGEDQESSAAEKNKEEEEKEEEENHNSDEDMEDEPILWELDDRVSTCLANGDVEGGGEGLLRCYARFCAPSSSRTKRVEHVEDVRMASTEEEEKAAMQLRRRQRLGGHDERFYRLLVHTWRCDWGALHVAHAHHRLMDSCRSILHEDERFVHQVMGSSSIRVTGTDSESPQGLRTTASSLGGGGGGGASGRSVGDIALKALYASASTLPRLSVSSSPTTSRPVRSSQDAERSISALHTLEASPPDAFTEWEEAMKALLPWTMGVKEVRAKAGGSSSTVSNTAASVMERNKRTVPFHYWCAATPRLQLQAFLSHIYPFVVNKGSSEEKSDARESPSLRDRILVAASGRSLLDALGASWGIKEVLPGCKASLQVLKERRRMEKSGNGAKAAAAATGSTTSPSLMSIYSLECAALQRAADRLERRLGTRLSPVEAGYVILVVFHLYEMLSGELMTECDTDTRSGENDKNTDGGTPLPLSLSLSEVERRLQWRATALGAHLGDLESFLQSVELFHPASGITYKRDENGTTPQPRRTSLSGRNHRLGGGSENKKYVAGLQSAGSVGQEGEVEPEKHPDGGGSSSVWMEHFLQQPVRLPLEGGNAAVVGAGGGKEKHHNAKASSVLSLFARRRTSQLRAPLPMPWVRLPTTAEASLHRQRLTRLAAEEILSGMPKESHIPMYIGDVGKLIGKWNHFNAKYDGVLGVGLRDFLEAHPQHWAVIDDVVTRRHSGCVAPVKLRYDENADHLDDSEGDDGDQGGAKQRRRDKNADGANGKKKKRWLSQKEKRSKMEARDLEKSSRARKKQLVKAFNHSRNNKNYKRMDPSARVPGYVKRVKGKTKGRGKKANIRNYKRGSA